MNCQRRTYQLIDLTSFRPIEGMDIEMTPCELLIAKHTMFQKWVAVERKPTQLEVERMKYHFRESQKRRGICL